ncbi:19617_t:CDS:2 [Racocetra fulgida]|uniref:19617_t:CDS:1 n=1 Tax=Racocetra fulgida TaxID=60492 RepID=A0A9N9C259_9GLOM|nr:19617_t:CDS:2 [Racocetra fulgida]
MTSKTSKIIKGTKTDTATPSATISAATTRASSVDPPRQLSESLTKVKRRNCQSNKKDGVVHKKTNDEDDLAKKRAYRAIERRAREKELEEEYLSLIEKTHPAYVENIGRLDEEHQKMQQLLENNRLLEIQQSQNLYESQVSQIRHVALPSETKLSKDEIEDDFVAMQLYTRTKPLSVPSPQPNNITAADFRAFYKPD